MMMQPYSEKRYNSKVERSNSSNSRMNKNASLSVERYNHKKQIERIR